MRSRQLSNLNYYEILGVPLDASLVEVRQAYEQALKGLAPTGSGSPEAVSEDDEALRLINRAYETLVNREKRKEYEGKLRSVTQDRLRSPFQTDIQLHDSLEMPGGIHYAQQQFSKSLQNTNRMQAERLVADRGVVASQIGETMINPVFDEVLGVNRQSPTVIFDGQVLKNQARKPNRQIQHSVRSRPRTFTELLLLSGSIAFILVVGGTFLVYLMTA